MISRAEAARRERAGRKKLGFIKFRFGQIKEARRETPDQPIEFYDPAKHLPPMPKWYAKFRASKAWQAIEFKFRSQHSSTCDDCKAFRRGEVFHTDHRKIWPADFSTLTLLCPACATKRTPLKPAVVKINAIHNKNNVRQTLKIKEFSLELDT
jgi:hypothetical protein